MRTILATCLAAATTLGAFAADAAAWSFKEHIQFTRLAAMRIVNDPSAPDDLKAWLTANTPLLASMEAEREWFLTAAVGEKPDATKLSGLTWWVCVPDLEAGDRRSEKRGPFGEHERLNHFIDLEFFNPDNAKKTYQFDLSSIPKIGDVPRDPKNETYVRAGYLPLAREHAYRKLVEAIKAGRLAPDPARPEDDDHAVKWAGYLAHYTEDNTQPQHATMDYKSARYFEPMRNAPNVHAEMEYRMADDATQPLPELRAKFWEAFAERLTSVKDDTSSDDPFESTLRVAMDSYRNLPLIGEAAKAAADVSDPKKPTVDTAKFFAHVGTVDGREQTVLEMKAHQTAWAVVRTEDVLRQAWAEATAK